MSLLNVCESCFLLSKNQCQFVLEQGTGWVLAARPTAPTYMRQTVKTLTMGPAGPLGPAVPSFPWGPWKYKIQTENPSRYCWCVKDSERMVAIKSSPSYSPWLQLVRWGRQHRVDLVNPANTTPPIKAAFSFLHLLLRPNTYTGLLQHRMSVCQTLNLICSETPLATFITDPLWSLMPRHQIYRQHNLSQICFIGQYNPEPAWSASH